MKINSFLTCFAVSILAMAAFNSASAITSLEDPMDSIGSWQLGGGSNAIDRTLTVDTTTYFEGTGSLKIQATYQAGGNAYTDMYETVSPVNLGAGPFSFNFDLLSSSTNVSLQITIGSSADNKYFNASYTPTSIGTWENVSLGLSSFGDTIASSDLSSIDFYRIRVIGDGLGSFPQTASVNVDNLQAVPEPASLAMVAAGLVSLGVLRRFRRSSIMLPAMLFTMLSTWQLRADPVTVAPEKFGSQIQEEKGSAVGGSEWKLTDAKPAELEWKVTTSTAQGFDFARLSFPVSFQINEASTIVLTGSLLLAADNYFGVELITKDGTLLYTAISTADVNTPMYQIPMSKFSVESGRTVTYPAEIVTVRLMFSGDKSPVVGENVLKLKTLGVQ